MVVIVVGSLSFCVVCVLFLKQKTAYEMRISDWSSDVCSSDLRNIGAAAATGSWIDRVYLRRAGDTGAGTLIGTYSYTGPLDAGKTYSRKEEMRLPVKVSDNYEVIVVTDAGNVVYEHGGEDNNRAVDDEIGRANV